MLDKTDQTGGTPEESDRRHGADQGQDGRNGEFRIQVAESSLDFREVRIAADKPTGAQILSAAGYRPVEDYGVLHWLPGGDLEEVRLNETVDLRGNGAERFIVAQTDRAFFLELEGERQEWLVPLINGATLKKLADKTGPDFIVVQEIEDAPDREIADDEMVDLRAKGLEKFHIRQAEILVEIKVNEKPVKIERGVHTGLQVKEAAIAQGVNIKVDFILTLHEGNGEEQTIGDTDPVKVHKGQEYTAIADDDNS
jgi:hypothetical protein